ncbi:hypothetical protein MYX84_05285 [Acidobacteria bacterium AH-259-O06]|nr:hypothetical protein [Acidobacteria bacterium AH-259-O06]
MRKKILIAGVFTFLALVSTAVLATNSLTGSSQCCGLCDILTRICG